MWDRVSTRFKEPFRRRRHTIIGQDAPTFLSVPAEIRHEIYRQLFGSEGVHLRRKGNHVTHSRCTRTDPIPGWGICCDANNDSLVTVGFWGVDLDLERERDSHNPSRISKLTTDLLRRIPSRRLRDKHINRNTDGSLAEQERHPDSLSARIPRVCTTSILLVNRQISSEALSTLYSSLTFHVDSLETFFRFAILISPEALTSIRRLRASWTALACLTQAPVPPNHPDYPQYEYYTAQSDDSYRAFWRILARNMHGLLDLSFVMDYSGQYLSRELDAAWHLPLRKVRGLHRFDLQIWDKMAGTEDVEEDMEALRDYLTREMTQPRRWGIGTRHQIVRSG